MSPVTDAERLKDIQKRSAEFWRIASLPDGDPDKPFVLVTRAHEDIRFLLTQISALRDEILELERLTEDDELQNLMGEDDGPRD